MDIESVEDGVLPSGTSMAILGLYRLNKFLKDKKYDKIIEETLKRNMKEMNLRLKELEELKK